MSKLQGESSPSLRRSSTEVEDSEPGLHRKQRAYSLTQASGLPSSSPSSEGITKEQMDILMNSYSTKDKDSTSQGPMVCDNDQEEEAAWWCNECSQKLCPLCDNVLHKSKHKQQHQRIRLKRKVRGSEEGVIGGSTRKPLSPLSTNSKPTSIRGHVPSGLDALLDDTTQQRHSSFIDRIPSSNSFVPSSMSVAGLTGPALAPGSPDRVPTIQPSSLTTTASGDMPAPAPRPTRGGGVGGERYNRTSSMPKKREEAIVQTATSTRRSSQTQPGRTSLSSTPSSTTRGGGTERGTTRGGGGGSGSDRRICKVLVVGNAKCGKSSVIQRYANNEFADSYKTTIGADYFRKTVKWNDEVTVHLQLWDIAGQDRFAQLTRPYYRNAVAAIVLCDVTRAATLEATKEWKKDLDDKLGDGAIPIILLANKCDLMPSGKASMETGARLQQIADEMGFRKCFLTSAKENDNVEEAMRFLIGAILENEPISKREEVGGIKLSSADAAAIKALEGSDKDKYKKNDCCS